MIDEEKAEEYADECFKGNDKDSQYYRTILIKGYLDGLAEGKPKWHDLRKDPNDLPKPENKYFSWSMTVSNQDGTACHYNYDKHCWETSFVTEVDVIAWCEFPKFEE